VAVVETKLFFPWNYFFLPHRLGVRYREIAHTTRPTRNPESVMRMHTLSTLGGAITQEIATVPSKANEHPEA